MGLGAIVVVGAEREGLTAVTSKKTIIEEPLACVEVLGRSMMERTVDQFLHADIDLVTVLAAAGVAADLPAIPRRRGKVRIEAVSDIDAAIAATVKDYSESGIGNSFITSANVYAESDLLDFFYFHREARGGITRAVDRDGQLDLWVVNCLATLPSDIESLMAGATNASASYCIGGYVQRLTRAEDLRKVVTDSLSARCAMRPSGQEVKPGIWIDDGAEVDRRARIVAPTYIGCGTKIQEDALITRCSSIEKDCHIEYGTVIEDSSVLANTHIGIWLDVCHAMASGNKLLSLEHDVVLEISDAGVMRSTSPARKAAKKEEVTYPQHEGRLAANSHQKTTPAPEWQLGANLIQG